MTNPLTKAKPVAATLPLASQDLYTAALDALMGGLSPEQQVLFRIVLGGRAPQDDRVANLESHLGRINDLEERIVSLEEFCGNRMLQPVVEVQELRQSIEKLEGLALEHHERLQKLEEKQEPKTNPLSELFTAEEVRECSTPDEILKLIGRKIGQVFKRSPANLPVSGEKPPPACSGPNEVSEPQNGAQQAAKRGDSESGKRRSAAIPIDDRICELWERHKHVGAVQAYLGPRISPKTGKRYSADEIREILRGRGVEVQTPQRSTPGFKPNLSPEQVTQKICNLWVKHKSIGKVQGSLGILINPKTGSSFRADDIRELLRENGYDVPDSARLKRTADREIPADVVPAAVAAEMREVVEDLPVRLPTNGKADRDDLERKVQAVRKVWGELTWPEGLKLGPVMVAEIILWIAANPDVTLPFRVSVEDGALVLTHFKPELRSARAAYAEGRMVFARFGDELKGKLREAEARNGQKRSSTGGL